MKWKVLNIKITVATLLSKDKGNEDIEYTPVYFNSATKTVINSDICDCDKSFQEVFYRIDNWFNEESS